MWHGVSELISYENLNKYNYYLFDNEKGVYKGVYSFKGYG